MIRNISKNDFNEVTEIYNYYISNTIVSFEQEEISVNEMTGRIDKVTAIAFPWIVAEVDNKIIGYAYASPWHIRSAYKHTAEITVYLSHQHISNGWGTKLYKTLFDELDKMPIHVVIAGVALPNPTSMALHEKFDMVEVAHFKKIGFKFNNWIDVVYLQKEIKSLL
jgi:phosphinothricin acetyltransferase